MSTDIHCVLQKRNKQTQKWETIDNEFMESRDYSVFTFLADVRGYSGDYDNIGFQGFPTDFEVDTVLDEFKHQGKWMGEHGFGWVDLKTFCEAALPEINLIDRYEVEKHNYGYSVNFTDPYEIDEYHTVRCLQTAFLNMYGRDMGTVEINGQIEHFTSVADYRIVYGFDS